MSVDAHPGFIKTPRQLVTVVVLSFLVPILVIVFLTQFITGSLTIREAKMNPAALTERIKPVAQVYVGDAPPPPPIVAAAAPAASGAAAGESRGQTVFGQLCTACHSAGLNGAPKLGDKAAWAPRIATGMETVYNAALHGLNAMPAKGGNPALSDADVKAAVDYMVNAAK